ncbi:hypothetical protein DUNSADRAFT_11189 [Dunaliella salina]|uniref:Encoded protein n=1 Tax=Dunaliella salina TaxID=3046 RepID=A0ABQ7GDY4_DUNSA|nr:hypothetical protein DUNSADRAFT_11189 [Dunaliella salina]|eukprot:KAF5832816.1 hypothetical protein DUNSADRAFT_11189 [Dunaliella salina]
MWKDQCKIVGRMHEDIAAHDRRCQDHMDAQEWSSTWLQAGRLGNATGHLVLLCPSHARQVIVECKCKFYLNKCKFYLTKLSKRAKREADFVPATEHEAQEEGAMEHVLASLRAHKRERMMMGEEADLAADSVDLNTQSGSNSDDIRVHMNRLAEMELNSSQRNLLSNSTRQAMVSGGGEDNPALTPGGEHISGLGTRMARRTRLCCNKDGDLASWAIFWQEK